MHIQLAQKNLEDAANIVSNLVDRSAGPMPVLSNLLVEANDGIVKFRGTDMESMVELNVEAAIKVEGKTTIPADTFRDIVRVLPPQGDVSIEDKGNNKILINCETNEFKIMSLPADEYPNWSASPGHTSIQLSQKVLKSLIDATSYALPSKDHRRVLLGVFFELADHKLQLTATDGKKLARIHMDVPEVEGPGEASIVIPRKLLDNLQRNLGGDGPVQIEFCGVEGGTARQAAFRFENVTYRVNGIEGKYPDCNSVIPKEFPTEIHLNRDIFLLACKRAGITTDDKNKSMILKFEDNTCQFHSMAHDLGTFSGQISLDYTGEAIEIAFNYQFMYETLSKFANPELRMLIKSPTAPIVFKSKDDDNRLSLLMPIKLSEARPAPVEDED